MVIGVRIFFFWFAILCGQHHLNAQRLYGTFENMDFEAATVVPVPGLPGLIVASNAVPRWEFNPMPLEGLMFYNGVSLGGAMVTLLGPGWAQPEQILEGTYSLKLNTFLFGQEYGAFLWQTGEIPAEAKSLIFYAAPDPQLKITFSGERLDFVKLQSRGAYDAFGADVARFAGQTGELRFATDGLAIIDSIRFSTTVIPEPSPATIAGIGIAVSLLCVRAKR